jgi:pyruvate dehydrogenase E1 component alpha subunit
MAGAVAAVTARTFEDLLNAGMPRLADVPTAVQLLDEQGNLTGPEPELSPDRLTELYRWMLWGRQLDERGLQLQRQGRVGIWGPMIGQEAAQAGLGLALRQGDWIFPSYREAIALCMHGLTLTELLAYYRGLYWRAEPHQTGVFPIQIVIGDQTLHAVGAGMGFALQGQPHVAVGVVGDGATSEGDFLEALNFAGVFKAKAVIVVQNNQWAISVPRSRQSACQTLAQKGLAFGVPSVMVDGNDALAMYAVADWALEHARSGEGPVLIEALTYRLGAHTTSDDPRRYQPPAEVDLWRTRDPVARLRRYLERRGLWDDVSEQRAVDAALERIDVAIVQAEALPEPSYPAYVEASRHG